jgi:hypothetical protein
MQKPLAIAIISGLAAQLPLALVVLPGLMVALRAGRGRQVGLTGREPADSPEEAANAAGQGGSS